MKTRLYLGIVLCVVLLVLLIVLWPTGMNRQPALTSGEIEQSSRESATPTAVPQGVSKPTVSPASKPEIPTPAQIVSATPTEKNAVSESNPTQKSLQVSIVDALGDPISAGLLRIGGQEFHFAEGRISVPMPGGGEQQMVAEAAGYQSATKSIDVSALDQVTLTLEYLSSYQFVVYADEQYSRVAERTKVILWRGASVERPVPDSTRIEIEGQFPYTIGLCREERGIRVVNGESRIDKRMKPLEQGGFDSLRSGDRIVGILECLWNRGDRSLHHTAGRMFPIKDPVSPRLRMWDSAVQRARSACTGSFYEGDIEFERGGLRLLSSLGYMESSPEREYVSEAVTDFTGRCYFNDLPPAIYYAQAQTPDMRSGVKPVHSACGGGELFLVKGNSLFVAVMRMGVEVSALAAVARADVLVRRTDSPASGGVLMGKTDRNGYLKFTSVPFGKYIVSVNPPSELGLPSREVHVVVEGPFNDVFVYLDSGGRTVSGIVRRADNREPVEGFSMSLHPRAMGIYGDYGPSRSGSDGRFVFHDVVPGEYDLRPLTGRDLYIGYLPIQGRLVPEFGSAIFERIVMEKEDIENIELLVIPGVSTRFIGKVIKPDGTPVEGAVITLAENTESGYKGLFGLEPDNRTGRNGMFDVSVITSPDDLVHQGRIVAAVPDTEKRADSKFKGAFGGASSANEISPDPCRAYGLAPVQFKIGDVVDNIRIVTDETEGEHVLIVTITTLDGNPPGPLAVEATQPDKNGLLTHHPGRSQDGKSYRIEGLKPGLMWFSINTQSVRTGTLPVQGYAVEVRQLNIPADVATTTVEVALTRLGYLKGKVVSKGQDGVRGAIVSARQGSAEPSGSSVTDEDGEFLVERLRSGEEHTLEVRLKDGGEPVARLEGLKPTVENIAIVVDKPQ